MYIQNQIKIFGLEKEKEKEKQRQNEKYCKKITKC